MATFLLHAGRAIGPSEEIPDAGILVRDGVIEAIGPRESLRLPAGAEEIRQLDATAVPGFVDVHIHGARGHDVMEGTSEAISAVAAAIGQCGTTAFLATTMTANPEETCRSVEGISRYLAKQHGSAPTQAEVLGIHFEGPFLSSVRRGVHPKEWLTPPSTELLGRLLEAAHGAGRILTMAPELAGWAPCVEAARRAGLLVAMGHTDADYEQTRAAIAGGARHAVHVYNAMRPFTHRDPGVIGAVLTSPEVTAELIADGVHVDHGAMRLLLQAKGVERVILISDGTSATGMPDGKYTLGTIEVTVSGGVCRNAEGRLAGSTLTLDRALRNITSLGFSLAQTVRMLTLNPATLLGVEYKKGALRPGADADIVLLDSALQIQRVWTRGTALGA